MKRVILVAIIIVMLPVGYIVSFLAICPLINNIRASSIEKDLAHIALPPETEMIETSSYIGNISGTGNHVEIWAGLLIRSNLDQEEVFEYYSDFEIVWAVPTDDNQYPEPQNYMTFPYLSINGNRVGCYIIAGYYIPVTQFDIRGQK